MHESSEGRQLRQLCEQESNELWKTITKLESESSDLAETGGRVLSTLNMYGMVP